MTAFPTRGRRLAADHHWRFRLCLVATAAIAPVAVYASNATVIVLWIAVLGVAALPDRSDLKQAVAQPFGAALAGLLVWGAVTGLWAPDGAQAVSRSLRVAVLALAGALLLGAMYRLDPLRSRQLRTWAVYAGLGMVGLFALEFVLHGTLASYLKGRETASLNAFQRGTTILAIMVWPLAAMTLVRWRSLPLAAGFVLATLVVLLLLPTEAATGAVIAGIVAFAAIYRYPRPAITAMSALLAIAIVTAPLIAVGSFEINAANANPLGLPMSWVHRLAVWDFSTRQILEHPLIGQGLDAARAIGRAGHIADVPDDFVPGGRLHVSLMPLHPHNAFFQIALELGAVGMLFACAMLYGAVRYIRGLADRPLAAATAGATFVSMLFIASISFGVWQSWWMAAEWLTAAFVVLALGELPATMAEAAAGGSAEAEPPSPPP